MGSLDLKLSRFRNNNIGGVLFFAFALFVSIIWGGCAAPKESSVVQKIKKLQDALKKENAYIDSLDRVRIAKYEEKAIDDTISLRLKNKLNTYRESNKAMLKELEKLQASLKNKSDFKTAYNSSFKSSLDAVEKKIYNKKEAAVKKTTLELIDESLASSKLNQFGLAAFFGSGLHQLTIQDIPLVEKTFGLLVDSLVIFSNKFSSIPREAILSIYGYADGQPIAVDSDLALKLQQQSGLKANTSTGLNKLLSLLRARQMNKIIDGILQKKVSSLKNRETLKITQYVQGMGETYPNPKIKNYTTDDERRRIVLFYWSVVPK